jgi:hypothetical protein
MDRYDAAQEGYNVAVRGLGLDAVSRLHLAGVIPLAAPSSNYAAASPVISAGVVYVTGYGLGQISVVYAYPASCGTSMSTCSPLWTATVGDDSVPRVVVVDGVVMVAGDDGGSPYPYGELYAYPVGCRSDGGTCPPMWTAELTDYTPLEAAPTVANGVVYEAGNNELSGFRNYLFAFPLHCGTGGAACVPLGRGQMNNGDTYGSVAVSGGVAYVPDYSGWIYGYDTGCGSDDALCQPVWSAYTGQLGPSAAAVADDQVVVGSQNDDLLAFPARCPGPCKPLWVGQTKQSIRSDPAVAKGVAYVTSDDGNLYAFWTGCRGACPPLWTATLSAAGIDSFHSSPAVADGVVYVTWGTTVSAFGASVTCSGPCQPLWSDSPGSYYELDGPSLAGGEVWVSGGPSAGPGTVYAFSA